MRKDQANANRTNTAIENFQARKILGGVFKKKISL